MNNIRIISIGGELTRGEILNTNAQYIADAVTRRGATVETVVELPDDPDIASGLLPEIIEKPGVIIITGGLGGTGDDLTRGIVSRAIDRPLFMDENGKRKLKQWYMGKNKPFTEADSMQAACPKGGVLLENRLGLAYGFRVEAGGRSIFCLPGVPKEMKEMFKSEVLPLLEAAGIFDTKYDSSVLTFAAIPEYTLDREVARIVSRFPGVSYGTRAGYGITRVLLESRQTDTGRCAGEIIRTLDEYLVSTNEKTLTEAVGERLKARRLTLSVAESCTAGYLAGTITDPAGSSAYFLGGVVAYGNEEKIKLLGVSPDTLKRRGAVSVQTAVEMARGVCDRFGSDFSISVTGIAGPGGGTEKKPVGTVCICVFTKEGGPDVGEYRFSGDREIVRYRSVIHALYMLHKRLRAGG
ncbi:MAG: CinA family nicotinamide mononucleotide deamidase-related protein [Spirochaetes bacterium]|nr:CinA family nicotinamide mononucleotide deamidase-related protein [Spirochaetota bacterium]